MSIGSLAAVAVAVAGLSVTISRAGILAPLRDWVAKRNKWAGDLLACGYCVSHWLTAVIVGSPTPYRPAFGLPLFADVVLSIFFVVAVSALVAGVVVKLTFEPAKPKDG